MSATGHNSPTESVHFRPRRKTRSRELTSITLNLAPMVDVVFLLLIFFVSTTTLKRAEGVLKAQLPKQGNLADEIAMPITPIIVHLTQTGAGPNDYALRLESFVNQPTTFNELRDQLADIQTLPGFDNQTPVVLKAGDNVAWDHVVGSWNAAVAAGCKHVSFGGE